MTIDNMWDELEQRGVSEETLQVVTNINGYNEDALRDILFAVFGENVFDLEDEEEEEEEEC